MIKLIIWFKPFAKYFLAGWLLAIISISSIPSIPTLKIHTQHSEIRLDYLIHFCEYGVLAFVSFLSFAGDNFKVDIKLFLILTIALCVFAVIDEFHQKFIPGRSFNPRDIFSNISGIIGAVVFCLVIFKKIGKNPGLNPPANKEG